ncbi:hypothetical protein G3N57_12840 [Paraburkholderia sp. Se-20369]|nr:hypothetical protein [Paraburkholderia sp. Se-20369]
MATGLQHSFDWKGVAASAIASGAGYQAGALANQAGVSLGFDMTGASGRFASGVTAGVAAGAASTVVRGGSLGRNVGAIAMDAIAGTVGNMIVDQIASRDTTQLRTRQAIEGMNDSTLPGGLGGVGSGFIAPQTPYSGNVRLFGVFGGVVDSSPMPYSMSSTLYGPGMGIAAAPEKTPLSGESFRAQFNEPLPGVFMAGGVVPKEDAGPLGFLGLEASTQNKLFGGLEIIPRLSADTGPKLVPQTSPAAQRANADAMFMRFMETQGTQPLGGLMANAAIQATGNAEYAVAVGDAAGMLDALWTPGGARAASVASVRRGQITSPGVTREGIVSRLGEVVQPHLKAIVQLDPDALVGFRGSLARGFTGPHKGNIPFNTGSFDVDAFIVSDKLAAQFTGRVPFRSGNKIDSIKVVQRSIEASLRQSPEFAGLRDELFAFRIFTQQEIQRNQSQSDAQYFFLKPSQK